MFTAFLVALIFLDLRALLKSIVFLTALIVEIVVDLLHSIRHETKHSLIELFFIPTLPHEDDTTSEYIAGMMKFSHDQMVSILHDKHKDGTKSSKGKLSKKKFREAASKQKNKKQILM